MFSLLGPGGLISPHSDPENIFLTCHLGLIVPEDCGIEVGGELRRWEEGRCVIFDAAFEHHAFNRSPSPRVLLLIDFLHPHFTEVERRFFKAYFAAEAQAA
jgi:aspartyl/asparaginyl beta-hydroxylase (cupin superfamily)